MDLPVENARDDVIVSYALKLSPSRRVRLGLKNISRHQTSTWQSFLCRNLFVALQVENPRRNTVVSDHL
jgi:hypothetical protein